MQYLYTLIKALRSDIDAKHTLKSAGKQSIIGADALGRNKYLYLKQI